MTDFIFPRFSLIFLRFLMVLYVMQDTPSPNRTLDLASALEVGPTGNRSSGDNAGHCGSTKSVMTIAFQFAFEIHLQDNVALMARQYIRSIIASVQRVALALSPSRFGSHAGFRPPPGTPEAQTLAGWICQSYRWVRWQYDYLGQISCMYNWWLQDINLYLFRCYLGVELLKSEGSESILKSLWHHSDAILCCSLKVYVHRFLCFYSLKYSFQPMILKVFSMPWSILTGLCRHCQYLHLQTRQASTCLRRPWLHFKTSHWKRFSMTMEGRSCLPSSHRSCSRYGIDF